jgi:agmatine deiminase
MSWPTALIWGPDLLDVRDDISGIARAIADFEHVVMLASPHDADGAAKACGSDVEVVAIPVDDLWARDTSPVFVTGPDGLAGIDVNFNGWGDKQQHDRDALVAAGLLEQFGIPAVTAGLVAEGGSLETDGLGTLLVTESSIVNANRNPGLSRAEIEAELRALLGLQKVIWFDGVYGYDITDAHVDSLARFVAPGVVLLDTAPAGTPEDVWSRSAAQARRVLSEETDARGSAIDVIDMPQPDLAEIRGAGDDFLASYVNFTVCNGAVLLPEFGDRRADDRARGLLQDQFPGREVIALPIDTVASGGGGIHCATRDLPRVPAA